MTTVLSYDIIKSYKKTRERKKVLAKLKGGNAVFLLKLEEVQQNVDFTKVERLLEQHVFSVEELGKKWYSLEDLCKYFEIKQEDYLDIMSELWHVDEQFEPYGDENLGWIVQKDELVLATNFEEVCVLIYYGASEEKRREVSF